MAESDLFEEMLAAYPAEKRELARAVYHRFADGDSTQFFSQLFLVLDVYAHYAERIPARMISANADSLATLQELREEVSLLAKTIETRDANITNHAEKTDELCRATQEKCDETITAIKLTVKNLGAQVDTKAIVQGVQNSIQSGIDQKIIAPFVQHTNDLAWKVMPTLEKNQAAADEAKSEWSKQIWKTAWTTSLFWSMGAAILIVCLICLGLIIRKPSGWRHTFWCASSVWPSGALWKCGCAARGWATAPGNCSRKSPPSAAWTWCCLSKKPPARTCMRCACEWSPAQIVQWPNCWFV